MYRPDPMPGQPPAAREHVVRVLHEAFTNRNLSKLGTSTSSVLLLLCLLPLGVLPLLGGVGFEAGISLTDAIVGQLIGIIVVAFWAMAGSAIVALAISVIIPMRVAEPVENEGLDAAHHGEQSRDKFYERAN